MSVQHFTSSDGVRLAYEAFGDDNSGTPLVLCHGIAVNGLQFHEDAAWFSARGHRVLVPHLRGHGLSDSPVPVSRDTLTVPRLAADLVEMLDDAGADKVHWVGNSLGGIVALEMLKAGRFATLTTFGTSYSIKLPFIFSFAPVVGLLFDRTGSYRLPFLIIAASLAFAAVCFYLLRVILDGRRGIVESPAMR